MSMVYGNFKIRPSLVEYDIDDLYEWYPSLFSIKIHHSGFLMELPGRLYVNGKINFVDLLNIDNFCIIQLDVLMQDMENKSKSIMNTKAKTGKSLPEDEEDGVIDEGYNKEERKKDDASEI
ncbi:hypothetical protein E3N88_11041 [Mikania micrantha]|uniref:Uncharacterized protein n=1 Tax=Mikania micrantha TaxID=192012 RepID=A0A5N6PCB2_9ASTR|nr:hypothetical protein E3N88_11041 [Mikania micrantha]